MYDSALLADVAGDVHSWGSLEEASDSAFALVLAYCCAVRLVIWLSLLAA